MTQENIEGRIDIDCDCGTHILKVEVDPDFQAIYLAMFNYGHSTPKWGRRLKMIWTILKTGEAYSDQLVMNTNEAKKLADFLNNHLKPNQQP